MKTESISNQDDGVVDEYDEYQYEYTSEVAFRFIEEEILPFLEEFDYENPEEDYVPGMATYSLFNKLIEMLLLQGFTPEQLKESIDEFSVTYMDETIH